jgi:hypothetical protein
MCHTLEIVIISMVNEIYGWQVGLMEEKQCLTQTPWLSLYGGTSRFFILGWTIFLLTSKCFDSGVEGLRGWERERERGLKNPSLYVVQSRFYMLGICWSNFRSQYTANTAKMTPWFRHLKRLEQNVAQTENCHVTRTEKKFGLATRVHNHINY